MNPDEFTTGTRDEHYNRYDRVIDTRARGVILLNRRGGKTVVSELRAIPQKGRRVLRPATVEAYGRLGAYVSRHRAMQRTNITDVKEFQAIAEYVNRRDRVR